MRIPLVPTLAVLAVVFAVYHVSHSQTPLKQTKPPIMPAQSPFSSKVAGAGIVEARSENIEIAADVAGVVKRVHVIWGDKVQPRQQLVSLDARDIQAEIEVRKADLKSAEVELERLRNQPRPEEIPPLEAAVAEAEARLTRAEDIYGRQQRLTQQQVTTQEELVIARTDLLTAQALLKKAEADLALLKAGAWEQDLLVAKANVSRMRSEVDKFMVEAERHELLAPVSHFADGSDEPITWEVLQINIRPGEFVATPPQEPILILGDAGPRRIRVDIDEYDLPRFKPTGKAVAFARGDASRSYPLDFVRVEPFVVPKRSLTGDNSERVDTRVLQVIYEFAEPANDVYVGQQMDVFIETESVIQAAVPTE